MTLHFAKYTGYFTCAKQKRDRNLFDRTLIDAFIIVLASANCLNVSLTERLDAGDMAKYLDLGRIGQALARQLLQGQGDQFEYSATALAIHSGRMAKACEALDHLEGLDFRGELERSLLEIARVVVAMASYLGIDLEARTMERWRSIEQKSILLNERHENSTEATKPFSTTAQ